MASYNNGLNHRFPQGVDTTSWEHWKDPGGGRSVECNWDAVNKNKDVVEAKKEKRRKY